ncbi:hypothetical protein C8D89_104126 [Actinomycetospora cinnamomea]|uniref:Uncharacterized protein n=1 Tax=Actinomycetospora cinnamomea TaxID=663609 RepID=A0A2U1FFE7_9PSEU|nr:hypothetical protein C8D89_104126 [Actinomycetospora cinnamomea]
MGAISYVFGTGRGPVHRHVTPADADLPGGASAAPDAVVLDFDGDGRVDDALWDSDGDGVADRSVLDLDDDGRGDHAYTDPSGRGVWDVRVPLDSGPGATAGVALTWSDVRGRSGSGAAVLDTDGDGVVDGLAVDADHVPGEEVLCDLDGDGRAEQMLVDDDRDGRAELAYLSADPGSPSARWDVLLVDTDADGAVDTAIAEGAAGWVPP